MIKHLMHWRKRPFIYSLILTLGFLIYFFALENEQPEYYPYIVVTLSLVFLLELASTVYLGRKLLMQLNLPEVVIKDKFAHTVQHIFLPISLFISLVCFMFFHKFVVIKGVFIIIAFIVFWILFTNIRAFYEDKFKIELKTHYIYDIISILSFFGLYDSLLNASHYWGYNNILTGVFVAILSVLFLFIVIVRLYDYSLIKFVIPILLINIGVFIIFNAFGLESIRISFISTFSYYFFIAFAHHHKEGTKSLRVFEEYFVLLLIAIVLLIFN